jgi:hypothetical protein
MLFDFKTMIVTVKKYSLWFGRGQEIPDLKGLQLDGSPDGKEWIGISKSIKADPGNVRSGLTIECSGPGTLKVFRFIRLSHANSAECKRFTLSRIELLGQLFFPGKLRVPVPQYCLPKGILRVLSSDVQVGSDGDGISEMVAGQDTPVSCRQLLADDCERAWCSLNQPQSRIFFAFTGHGLTVESYCLCSPLVEHFGRPKSWCLKGSTDGIDWIEIDSRSNEELAPGCVKMFDCSKSSGLFRYLQFVQNGCNHRSQNYLCLSAIEFFGTLYHSDSLVSLSDVLKEQKIEQVAQPVSSIISIFDALYQQGEAGKNGLVFNCSEFQQNAQFMRNIWQLFASDNKSRFETSDMESWLQFHFIRASVCIKEYVIHLSTASNTLYHWKIMGSNDGEQWVEIHRDERKADETAAVRRSIAGNEYFHYIRLIDATCDLDLVGMSIIRLEFYGFFNCVP